MIFKKKAAQPSLPVEVRIPIENELNLVNLVCISKNGEDYWCIANVKGEGEKAIYQFKFLWEFSPHHENAINHESMSGLVDLIGSVGKGEGIEFIHQAFKDPRGSYTPANSKSLTPELRLLQGNRSHRLKQLTERGIRRRHRHFISKGFEIFPSEIDTVGSFEKVLARGIRFYKKHLEGSAAESHERKVLNLGKEAYQRCLEYQAEIKLTAELNAELVQGDDLWLFLWERFNGYQSTEAPKLPYYLYINLDDQEAFEVDRNGSEVQPEQRMELLSYLIPQDSLPEPHAEWINLPARNQYCGVIGFEDIPDDFGSPEAKYLFFWNLLFGTKADPISADIELFTQVTWADPVGSLKQLESFTKQQRRDLDEAKRKGDEGTVSQLDAEQGSLAQRMLHTGDFPQFIAPAILVYAPTIEDMERTVLNLCKRFKLPTKAFQERDFAWKAWLQTTLLKQDPLFYDNPNSFIPMPASDYRLKINISAAMGMTPVAGVPAPKGIGTPFITCNGGIEYPLLTKDDGGNARMGAIFGKTGSGKSAMATGILHTEQSLGKPCTVVDLPDNSGHSTYGYYCAFHNGAIFDPGKSKNNILQKPDFSGLSTEQRENRELDFTKIVNQMLKTLIVDTLESIEGVPITEVDTVLKTASSRFYRDPKTISALDAAISGGVGSSAWQDYPTIRHFHDFLAIENVENLDLDADNEKLEEARKFVRMRLRYWLDDPALSQAIAQPSEEDFDSNPLALFSLRNITTEAEATVLGLSAHNCAIRRSMARLETFYYTDECSVFLDYEHMARNLGEGMATLRKSGVSMLLAMQDPNAMDPYEKIKQNLSYRLIGKVEANSIKHFERIFETPRHLLKPNTTNTRHRPTFSTRWLIEDDGGVFTACRYFSPPIELGLILNSKEEAACRDLFLQAYPDKYQAIARYSAWATSKMMANQLFYPQDAEAFLNGDRLIRPMAVA